MMKTISKLFVLIFPLLFFTCEQEEYAFGDITAPANLTVDATIVGQGGDTPNGDGSGLVNLIATADNAITYKYVFSDGTEEIAPSGRLTKRFTQVGVNTYGITVIASGTAGVATTATTSVTVESNFSDPEVLQFLTGGDSKTWYWAADEAAHLGVGQNDDNADANYFANYYQAAPFEKDGPEESQCLYQDELVFSQQDGQLFYQLNNQGQTYFNVAYQDVAGGSAGFDFCYDFEVDDSPQLVALGPSESFVAGNDIPGQTRGTVMNFTDGGFMSYYVGASRYEILSITANRLVVRVVQANNTALAWYQVFSSTKPSIGQDDTDYENLVWSDEFDTDGGLDASKWNYELGDGCPDLCGWGNGESQFYTDREDNVVVADGVLKITAQREAFSGADFTSGRMTTQDKFEFTYGRIDIRAKLPSGGGTWPALWLLGENINDIGWPACGEIDVMEHVGNQQNTVFSTLHYPGNSGGNGRSMSIVDEDVSEEFHVYSAIWSPETIRFFVDDQLFHTFPNDPTLPFNSDFFLIFNVAVGGSFGGAIAPDFNQSAMEVDYIRVYQ
ncbi:MAG: glycoside hydrolase family 16 protein [Bacteroidota bacterium]